MVPPVGDADHTENCRLPHIMQVHLSDGDIELTAQPAYDGLEHRALPFEGAVARYVKLDRADPDHHVIPRRLSDENL